jgi:hypothetical protein
MKAPNGKSILRTIVEYRNDRVRLACGHFVVAPFNTLSLVGGPRVGNAIVCTECEQSRDGIPTRYRP